MDKTVALAGNPNCGKTTLFNTLTGAHHTVGNWAGVTVEKKTGRAVLGGKAYWITDLPGTYSLSPYTVEEACARDYLLQGEANVILDVLDGTNLERNLYLALQLLELEKPLVLAVNLMDEVEARGGAVDCSRLSALLGVPVAPISARSGRGVPELMELAWAAEDTAKSRVRYGAQAERALAQMQVALSESPATLRFATRYYAARLLEGEQPVDLSLPTDETQERRIVGIARDFSAQGGMPGDALLAEERYALIEGMARQAVRKPPGSRPTATERIDAVLTHRLLAIPIFLLLMFTMFTTVFGRAGSAMKAALEGFFSGVLAPCSSGWLLSLGAPAWLRSLLVDGVIGGVGGVLAFLPQMALLFLFLSLLEDSGYLARAAFIMDRPLRRLGLTGKAFIPMLTGFGCTTPAIMAARALETERDRRLTILLLPFLSCGARMPVYALLAGVFFQRYQGAVVFGMYLLGAALAVCAGLCLRGTLFRGGQAPLVLELPAYRLPTLRGTLTHLWEKCGGFVVKAGTVLFWMSILVWMLQSFDGSLRYLGPAAGGEGSLFALLGAWLAPALRPLGFGTWQAAAALLSGVVAKEAVVSTMGVLYGGAQGLGPAVATWFTPASALSFMVFTLLYTPCVAALSTMRRELGSWRWMLCSAVGQCAVAYLAAFLTYRAALLLL